MVTILWMIWCRQNQKGWNDVFPVAFEVSRRAIEALEVYSQMEGDKTTELADKIRNIHRAIFQMKTYDNKP